MIQNLNQKLIDSIKRTNRKFERMTKPQQRVQIAKDVIAQLNTQFLQATQGRYVELPRFITGELSCELPKLPNCKVCARGALFVGLVLRKNEFEVHVARYLDDFQFNDYMKKIFTQSQLDLIEDAFENTDLSRIYYPDQSADERMKSIMKNIIRNKGTFRPKKGIDYVNY